MNESLPNLLILLEQHGLLSSSALEKFTHERAQFPALSALEFIHQEVLLSDEQVAKFCAKYYHLPFDSLQSLSAVTLQQQSLQLETSAMIKHHCLPIESENKLTLYIADPELLDLQERFRCYTELDISVVFSPYLQVIKHVEQLRTYLQYSKAQNAYQHTNIVHLVEEILRDAHLKQASDIHIEPEQQVLGIRFRVNGLLHPITQLPKALHQQIISRLKVMADLNISEHRLPQDGRFHLELTDLGSHECRINLCPSLHGEKAVIRLLKKDPQYFDIYSLGLSEKDIGMVTEQLKKPHGLILITGPTGSGKTVTLYTLLKLLQNPHKNISTIENPVEIDIPGITQINTHSESGLGFEVALRALLRQDPDIIMIGEIRDKTTADIALKAANTGHLVLASLHTNSCSETLLRLNMMGIPLYQILNAIQLIIAQRLLRQLCPHCRVLDTLHANTQTSPCYQADTSNTCSYCQYGYQGRIGAFEVMPLSSAMINGMKEALLTKHDIEKIACQEGMTPLRESARQHVIHGRTSYEEFYRALGH